MNWQVIREIGAGEGQPLARIGLVSDTHVPDRLDELHPQLLPYLRDRGVKRIFHLGDISAQSVLDELTGVAPVSACLGNRDGSIRPRLPLVRFEQVAGVRFALTHGHFGFWNYWVDKFRYVLNGYDPRRYLPKALAAGNGADVILFGHSHQLECHEINGVYLVNPGAAGMGLRKEVVPTAGCAFVYSGGRVRIELVALTGARLMGRRWKTDGAILDSSSVLTDRHEHDINAPMFTIPVTKRQTKHSLLREGAAAFNRM